MKHIRTLVLVPALLLAACVREPQAGEDMRALGSSQPGSSQRASTTQKTKPTSQPTPKPEVVAKNKDTARPQPAPAKFRTTPMTSEELPKTDAEWKKILTADEYHILREHGTERRGTGYWNNKRKGSYFCAGCGQHLFESATKYESGSGWPAFWDPANKEAIETETDTSAGMVRVEVHCKNCKGHLGHVFEDGPKPTGLRYCINSISMKFKEADEKQGEKKDD